MEGINNADSSSGAVVPIDIAQMPAAVNANGKHENAHPAAVQPAVMLRTLTEQDGPALAGLSYSSPDSGSVRYAANYRVDAFQAVKALHGDMEGVAAWASGSRRLVGVGLLRFGACQFQGEARPFALLGNLIVHPDYRGKGLASDLVQWQVGRARERLDGAGVLLANYQYGNRSTEYLFTRWMGQVLGPLVYYPLPTLASPPQPPERRRGAASPGLWAGPLGENEFEAFVDGLNTFYQEHTFHQVFTPDLLLDLVQRSPFDSPFRHAYTVVDGRGHLLAGLVAMEEYRIKEMEIRGLPRTLALMNNLLHFLPRDGAVREVYLDHIWYLPGHAAAARHLVDMVRWIWAARATNVSALFDPRGPLAAVFPTRPWSITARTMVSVHGPGVADPRRFIKAVY
jgi:GNAT superfamily N-acetyltransferase